MNMHRRLNGVVLVLAVALGAGSMVWAQRPGRGGMEGEELPVIYQIQRVAREGIRTINDRPLPAVAGGGGVVAPGVGEPVAPAGLPPIRELGNLVPRPAVFESASVRRPLVLRSTEDAARCFTGESLAALNRAVDFDRQFVLLFAWSGSGQDRLTHVVAESYPEQIRFTYTPGRTRDLRQHVKVFALRNNVQWTLPGETAPR